MTGISLWKHGLGSMLALFLLAGCGNVSLAPAPTETTIPPVATFAPSTTLPSVPPAATYAPTQTLRPTLSADRPSSTPAEMPVGPGIEWRLVVISDSSGWGLGAAFASQIEKDLGVKVTVDDFAIGDLSAADVLKELQNNTSPIPRLEALPAALANADVLLLFPSPMGSLDNAAFTSFQRCFGNAVGIPAACTSQGTGQYTTDLEAIWAIIFEYRMGKPTILRALEAATPFIPRWNENRIFEPCTACWESYSAATRRAAETYHIPFLSRYDVYNGIDHNLDPGQAGYIGGDGLHPNGLAQQYTSELLSKLGYEPVSPP